MSECKPLAGGLAGVIAAAAATADTALAGATFESYSFEVGLTQKINRNCPSCQFMFNVHRAPYARSHGEH